MTLFDAILSLVPNARFSIENNDYDTINWSDSRDKPTREEVDTSHSSQWFRTDEIVTYRKR